MDSIGIGQGVLVVACVCGVSVACGLSGVAAAYCRQPVFVTEMAVGVGMYVMWDASVPTLKAVLNMLAAIGVVQLMAGVGSGVSADVFARYTRLLWLVGSVGTGVPVIIVVILGVAFPTATIAGPEGSSGAVALLVACGVAIASLPFISRIFREQGIVGSSFAAVTLGSAAVDDVVLWCLLIVATSTAGGAWSVEVARHLALHGAVLSAVGFASRYVGIRMAGTPRVVSAICVSATVGGAVSVGLMSGVASPLAAFVSGVGLLAGARAVGRERMMTMSLEDVSGRRWGSCVPAYFMYIGYSIGETGIAIGLCLVYAGGSSVLRITAVTVAVRAAGKALRSALNFGVVANARGGPGLVVATIGYESRIINAEMFSAMVVTAVVTSYVAAVWLRRELTQGWDPNRW